MQNSFLLNSNNILLENYLFFNRKLINDLINLHFLEKNEFHSLSTTKAQSCSFLPCLFVFRV
jgi:hypothetical protein